MNREELIKALEYTEAKYRNKPILNLGIDMDIPAMCSDVLSVIKNCIEIPEGATNGDFIRTIFPDDGIYRTHGDEICIYLHDNDNGCMYFSLEWWNAPFKVEKEDK